VFLNFRRVAMSSIVRIGSGSMRDTGACAGMERTAFREAIEHLTLKIKV
jgi:hypothetical protein